MPHAETWQERKRERSIKYWRRHGVGEETCTACSGSGYYDHNGSPACGGCEGTGRRRGRLNPEDEAVRAIESIAREQRNLIEMRRAMREGREPNLEILKYVILDPEKGV